MTRKLTLVALVGCALLSLAAAPPLGSAHSFVVLREYGAGTASRAQPYLDELLRAVAEQNHWPKATGRYFAERASALAFVREQKPDFGILSLSAYLALKDTLSPSVIGEVTAAHQLRSQCAEVRSTHIALIHFRVLAVPRPPCEPHPSRVPVSI